MNKDGSVDYHTLLNRFVEKVKIGDFGDVDIERIFDAGHENPISIVLQNRRTRRVRLVELQRDGTTHDPANHMHYEPHEIFRA